VNGDAYEGQRMEAFSDRRIQKEKLGIEWAKILK
jgi:hypothetical protein